MKDKIKNFSIMEKFDGAVLTIAILLMLCVVVEVSAAPKEHKFKSPSFSGINHITSRLRTKRHPEKMRLSKK